MTINFNSKEIATSLAISTSIYQSEDQKKKYSNIRECPAYSEWYGMVHILKMMNIPFDFECNKEATKIIKITVCDTSVNVENF